LGEQIGEELSHIRRLSPDAGWLSRRVSPPPASVNLGNLLHCGNAGYSIERASDAAAIERSSGPAARSLIKL
jgi:hypothetical protein